MSIRHWNYGKKQRKLVTVKHNMYWDHVMQEMQNIVIRIKFIKTCRKQKNGFKKRRIRDMKGLRKHWNASST